MRKLSVLGIALALASCGAAQDMNDAGEQVAAFHRAYDAEKFGQLWDGASPTMQQITPREQFLGLMAGLRQRLGAVKSTSRTGFNVNYATGGSQVTLTHQTTFANGEGTETFIYDTAEPPRLMGWHVVSPALLAPAPVQVEMKKVDQPTE